MPNPDLNNTHFKFIYVNPFNAISIRKCLCTVTNNNNSQSLVLTVPSKPPS